MIDHAGARVLVTGAASGIGKALAQALAARGAKLVLADIDAAPIEAFATSIGADAITIDLAEIDAPTRLIAAATKNGSIHLLCSNAGIGRSKRLLKESDAEMARVFAVNFSAGVKLAQAYAAALGEGARGRIMFTASENSLSVPAGVRGFGLGAYAASKHALLAAAEWLRDEAANIDIHVLLPGPVFTPLVSRGTADASQIPPGLNFLMPEQCAAIALKGMDLGLFYIPTHAHIADDMRSRADGVIAAIEALRSEMPQR